MSSPRTEFVKGFSITDAVMIGVGGMVGSAIFVFSGITIGFLRTAAPWAWLAAGVLMLITALVCAQLALRFSEAGSVYLYPRKCLPFGRPVSYMCGWFWVLSNSILAQTVTALGAAYYTQALIPSIPVLPIALFYLILVTCANLAGGRVFRWLQTPLTVFLLGGLGLFILAGLPGLSWAALRPDAVSVTLFLRGIGVAWLGYGAWVAILSAIEEVREPHRTVPLALTYTLAITTVFYTAIMLVSTGATGGQGFDSGLGAQAPLVYAATYFSVKGLVSFLAKLVVPIAALLACLTTMNVLMLDGSRVLYAMSRDGDLPHVYSYLHPRFRTPVAGILTVAVLALVGLFCPQYVFYIVQVGAFGNSFAFLLAMLSFIWANKGTATWKSVLALVSALSIVVVATTYEPVTYRLALIWGAIGAVVGLAWRLVLRGRKESGSV